MRASPDVCVCVFVSVCTCVCVVWGHALRPDPGNMDTMTHWIHLPTPASRSQEPIILFRQRQQGFEGGLDVTSRRELSGRLPDPPSFSYTQTQACIWHSNVHQSGATRDSLSVADTSRDGHMCRRHVQSFGTENGAVLATCGTSRTRGVPRP